MFCIPLRDRQVALQLLLELCIQQGSLHCALQTVLLLLELWDTGETEQVAKFYKMISPDSFSSSNIHTRI